MSRSCHDSHVPCKGGKCSSKLTETQQRLQTSKEILEVLPTEGISISQQIKKLTVKRHDLRNGAPGRAGGHLEIWMQSQTHFGPKGCNKNLVGDVGGCGCDFLDEGGKCTVRSLPEFLSKEGLVFLKAKHRRSAARLSRAEICEVGVASAESFGDTVTRGACVPCLWVLVLCCSDVCHLAAEAVKGRAIGVWMGLVHLGQVMTGS